MEQDIILLTEKDEEKSRMDIWRAYDRSRKSAKRLFYWNTLKGIRQGGLYYANFGDAIAYEKQFSVLMEVATRLGYEVYARKEIGQSKYRRSPKINIAGRTYCLILKEGESHQTSGGDAHSKEELSLKGR